VKRLGQVAPKIFRAAEVRIDSFWRSSGARAVYADLARRFTSGYSLFALSAQFPKFSDSFLNLQKKKPSHLANGF
jgi:hypothetical protein